MKTTELIIRVLTISSLAGLLFTVGLRLKLEQVLGAVRKCRLGLILLVNFIAVPLATVLAAKAAGLEQSVATAMILLAAAPFAPVVPVFARLARADLALAAGLTTIVPLLSAFLTPVACVLALKVLPYTGDVRLSVPGILLTLMLTIILPLGAGVAVNHALPALGARLLRPLEMVSEAAGALSLTFVVATEFGSMLSLNWRAVVVMVLLSEVSLVAGYAIANGSRPARQVVALGTSNRNIALALLVALENFGGTPVVPAVVANGLLLILFGLAHVGIWRLAQLPKARAV